MATTDEKTDSGILFWIKVAVGVLVCFLALKVFDRIGDLIWSFQSAPQALYGSDGADGTTEAVWNALRQVLQALAAIGSAVMVVAWAIAKAWWRKKWQKDEVVVPDPVVPDGNDEHQRKLLDLLRKLKERLT